MKLWNTENTTCNTWFERDRAMVRLASRRDDKDVLVLWDRQVSEFVDDGFKRQGQSWHDACIEYANEFGLVKTEKF